MKQVFYREPYTNQQPQKMLGVKYAIDHRMYRRQMAEGQLESIEEKSDNVGRMVCHLIEVLYGEGKISDVTLLKLLGDGYTLI